MNQSYIALGSNIGDSIANLRQAIIEMSKTVKLIACSSLYLTKPWGYIDQPDFINAVISIETAMSPYALLGQLKALEKKMGRERIIHWGPRTIDLDILTFNQESISEPDLTIPHSLMLERAFVLVPLAEIDKTYLAALNKLSEKSRSEIQKLDNEPFNLFLTDMLSQFPQPR